MSKQDILAWMDNNEATFTEMAKQIWQNPEVGYTESFASSPQAEAMEKEGFRVTRNVGEVSTAFVAEYGKGKPIIGIMGEFDALPGLSQQLDFNENPVVEGGPGHGTRSQPAWNCRC